MVVTLCLAIAAVAIVGLAMLLKTTMLARYLVVGAVCRVGWAKKKAEKREQRCIPLAPLQASRRLAIFKADSPLLDFCRYNLLNEKLGLRPKETAERLARARQVIWIENLTLSLHDLPAAVALRP